MTMKTARPKFGVERTIIEGWGGIDGNPGFIEGERDYRPIDLKETGV